jgi:hypothetical protein
MQILMFRMRQATLRRNLRRAPLPYKNLHIHDPSSVLRAAAVDNQFPLLLEDHTQWFLKVSSTAQKKHIAQPIIYTLRQRLHSWRFRWKKVGHIRVQTCACQVISASCFEQLTDSASAV